MMPSDRSIRFSLVTLSLWAIAPAMAAAAIGAAYAWQAGRSAMERELKARARALAVDVARELTVPRTALLALATSPALAAGDFEAFRRQSLLMPKPDGAHIVLTDMSGRVRADSRLPPGAALPEPGEGGTSKAAAGRPRVSDLQVGPLTHDGMVAVEMPVELNGQVAYGLAMAFAPSMLTSILDRRGPEEGRAIVVDGNGLIVAHSSNVGDFAGRRIGAASLAAVRQGGGVFEGRSQDGFPILAANARVPGTGWSTLAATRLDLDDAALRRSIAGAAASGAVVLLLGLLSAEWHARRITAPLHALVGTADALTLGRLPRPIPPGVREASRIGAALTWTAAMLASQERERAGSASALREDEARFRTITDAMPQMVWSARPDGRHDYYNLRWYEYTGLRPDDGDGEAWRVLFRSGDLSRAMAAWRRSLATGEPYQAEYRLKRADGTWRWCLSRASPLRDPKTGAVQRWVGTCTDIQDLMQGRETLARSGIDLESLVAQRTAALIQAVDALHAEALERLQAEEALRQAQKMEAVGQLTGGIAHDFNNMLQGISSSIELVQRRAEQGRMAEAERHIESALKSVDRAAALTSRLLAFTRRHASQAVPVNPDELILGMEDLIRRGVRLSVEVELQTGGAWAVFCDPNQLENALLNLAINAGDAMPQGGRLAISTRQVRLDETDVAGHEGARPGDHTEIAVADTGTGMDEATRARAFEAFFTTKPAGRGTGLGLSQLLSFVRLTGGVVQIDSELGHGTTVRLYLPRHEDMQPAVSPPVPAC